MNSVLMITLPILAILFYVFAFFFHRMDYFHRQNKQFTCRNTFPYELNEPIELSKNLAGNIFLFLGLICEVLFFSFFMMATNESSASFYIVVIGGAILSVLIFALYFIPFKYVRAHLSVSLIAYVLSLALSLIFAVNATNATMDYYDYFVTGTGSGEFAELIITDIFAYSASLSAIVAFAVVCMTREPFRLNKVTQDDGTVTYERPKVFALASMEWLTVLTNILFIASLLFYVVAIG
ncbi:MAG: hypothetical protein LUB56_02590 [Coprobacillus sp.]|nr:hypothetical protein [Coprobacillus sp.]